MINRFFFLFANSLITDKTYWSPVPLAKCLAIDFLLLNSQQNLSYPAYARVGFLSLAQEVKSVAAGFLLNGRLRLLFWPLHYTLFKQPSHVKLMLANSCWQTQNWCVWTKQQHVGKLLATNRTCLYSRQQFANLLLCSFTHTNLSLPTRVGQQ